jgi:hypothetical protein
MLFRLLAEARLAITFAIASTLRYSAPPGALRLRWITYPRVVLGGMLARLYHRAGVPFEWTPLLSVPFLAAGAYFLYSGRLLLGVLLSGVHVVNDVADGVTMGFAVDGLRDADKPSGRMRLRRMLDTFVADVVARFALYLIFVLRVHQTGAVHPLLLALLIVVEISASMLSSAAELGARGAEFHYDFVLEPAAARRLVGRGYPIKVLLGQASAYHNYALLPLVGYLAPLERWAAPAFGLLLAVRAAVLVGRIAELRPAPPAAALSARPWEAAAAAAPPGRRSDRAR